MCVRESVCGSLSLSLWVCVCMHVVCVYACCVCVCMYVCVCASVSVDLRTSPTRLSFPILHELTRDATYTLSLSLPPPLSHSHPLTPLAGYVTPKWEFALSGKPNVEAFDMSSVEGEGRTLAHSRHTHAHKHTYTHIPTHTHSRAFSIANKERITHTHT